MDVRAVYEQIFKEMLSSTWNDVAINSQTFVTDRLPKSLLDGLMENPKSKIVVHCNRATGETQQQLKDAVDEARRKVAASDSPILPCQAQKLPYKPEVKDADTVVQPEVMYGREDFPIQVHKITTPEGETEYHIVNLDGETWVKQALYTLAVMKIEPDRIAPTILNCDLPARVAAEVDELFKLPPTSPCKSIASLTIGTKGLIPQALNRLGPQCASYQERLARIHLDRAEKLLAEKLSKAGGFDAAGALRGIQEYARNRATAANILGADLEEMVPGASERGDDAEFAFAERKLLADKIENKPFVKELSKKILGCKTMKEFRSLTAERGKEEKEWTGIAERLMLVEPTTEAVANLDKGFPQLMRTGLRNTISTAQVADDSKIPREQFETLARIRSLDLPDADKAVMVMEEPTLATNDGVMWAMKSEPMPTEVADFLPAYTVVNEKGAMPGMLCRIQGECHLLVSVTDVHGDISYHLVKQALQKNPDLRINFFGTCGSFTDKAGVATFVTPRESITSFEPPGLHAPVICPNKAVIPGGMDVKHTNVCTLLQEHDAPVKAMSAHSTVDMETYHICRGVAESGARPDVRIIMRVSDVVTSKSHGAQSKELQELRDPEFDNKMDQTVQAFGLIDKRR